MDRRAFVKNTAVTAGIISLAGPAAIAALQAKSKNKFPKYKGFNLLDFFSPNPTNSRQHTTEDNLRWMRDWGFDFVRLPIAYPYYLDIDRSKSITPEDTMRIDQRQVEKIDKLVLLAHRYNMHVSLNLHRAPGYCVNAGFNEPFNLWRDQAAQDAFNFHWGMWAKRYKNISPKKISFDLVNEPSWREDMNDQHSKRGPVPGDVYRKVAKAAAETIRKENRNHIVVADGNNTGSDVIPEIKDLNIAQSCRGYYPGIISHYKAPWAMKDTINIPAPKWPGQVGNDYLSREKLEKFYKPWIDLVNSGVGVHCGECGCWRRTPHDVFLSWFGDVLGILSENKIGFALWEFSGDFGVLNSNRADVAYENWHGQKLDRKLLDLMRKQ